MGFDDDAVTAMPGGVGRVVDARGAQGMLIGDYGVVFNYFDQRTWTDAAIRAPLADAVSGIVVSPYRGLAWFTELDAAFFFGREIATDTVVQRLSHSLVSPEIVMVSGESGAGKSSLLHAGVVPRLRRDGLGDAPQARNWPCLLLTPGRDPLGVLAVAVGQVAGLNAAALRRDLASYPRGFAWTAAQAAGRALADPDAPRGRLVLVVDQFEQIFTQCSDPGTRAAFVAALQAAVIAGSAVVVLVVRADFESRCESYPELVPRQATFGR
ncbi:ATP-binding protein [Nocardia sp. alder85J]|uniref:ATP-binding protein n=1 Tax=Nocardia sp. alder85J TaxID=2862949 RepID=UPI001CD651AF|nr:ATP-binding protein [Nocardia sp. alder85J]MCX4099328.1 ATP-binding protein [Nocardia sp. alder85J]